MSAIIDAQEGSRHLFMGNEAIARGALEAGVRVAAGYPGTPSSEIIENLAKVADKAGIYVEWSVNEKVAAEVAAAASFAGLRSLCVMKQNGVNVASDFLLHLAGSGIRGGMVLVPCDDPGALSSVNEGESRHFARLLEIPLLEPGDFQEAKDMMKWAFDLSEELRTMVMVRSVTRLSHASGNVIAGAIPKPEKQAEFRHSGFILDPMEGVVMSAPVAYKHGQQQEKLQKAVERFESAPFNTYTGPEKPELLIITASACNLYSREAVRLLNAGDRVGILKLGCTWPLPSKLLEKHLQHSEKILIVEEVIPFLEENVKILAAELAPRIGIKSFFGKRDKSLPSAGELNPDMVTAALSKILNIPYIGMEEAYEKQAKLSVFFNAPPRDWTFCAGCPHRASYWSIRRVLQLDNREGFVCGDIGCYTLGMLPSGYSVLKTVHSMGSGIGVASGFGKLRQFGMDQPVLAVCGDSTFFHAAMPALVNAVHHRSDITLIILDNSGTGMTGFQPHPGLCRDALSADAPAVDIADVCRAMGADVNICDPFDAKNSQKILLETIQNRRGVHVIIFRQICALSPEKKNRKLFDMSVREEKCLGENCGCNRLCTRILGCPGMIWDREKKKARIDTVICSGCGFCASVCPAGAIEKKEVAAS